MPENIQPSFSPRRRWKIGFDMLARTFLVLAVAVMANYIGAEFFHRFYLSSRTRVQLASRTTSVLRSLTNHVTVTLYYDRKDDFYPVVVALLDEYRAANPKISVQTVDYARDAGEAEKVKEQYKLNSASDKDLIIFDAGNGRVQIRPSDSLLKYAPTGMSKDRKIEFTPVAFNGEEMFTSMLLALEDARPFKAYFLQGRGEPSLTDSGQSGYLKFATILWENYHVDVQPLRLLGDSDVPDDCNLLIIAGPTEALSELELQKIKTYLAQGGRLFALFNYASVKQPTGLEPILQPWGVSIGMSIVRDMQNTTSSGMDVDVSNFSQHPVVNALARSELQMILPLPVGRVDLKNPPPDAPEVTELAFSGDKSTLVDYSAEPPRSYPLMVAVEQKNTAGVASPRGNTRMIITGDSIFLDNQVIEGGLGGANREFLGYAVNWLLDRPQLVEGIGPQRVTEFRLLITKSQQGEICWVLLGALPGAVLLLGGLVWLARRK